MKIFQFYFNPKLKDDLIFDSFCYEPKNISEKKLGSLYTIGILKNALPQNFDFLEKISKFIKEKYYQKTFLKPEKALKETLKETNEFLSEILKKGNVSWLGNLSFAILNLKNFVLNFTKIGEIKIYLLRGNKIIDIDKKLKFQDIEPYPLKVFGNIISGKLIEDDLILVFTKEVFDFFQSENLIEKLKELIPFDEKKFKKIIEEKKEVLSRIKGLSLVIYLTKEHKNIEKKIIAPKILKEFSIKDFFFFTFSPLLKRNAQLKEFSFLKIFSPYKENIKMILKNKKVILVLSFFLLLLLGYLWFY